MTKNSVKLKPILASVALLIMLTSTGISSVIPVHADDLDDISISKSSGTKSDVKVDPTALDTAVAAAKKAGVKVTQDSTRSVLVNKADQAKAQSDITNDYSSQVKAINAVTDTQNKDNDTYNTAKSQYDKDEATYKTAESKYESDESQYKQDLSKYNSDEAKYQKDLATYNKDKAELAANGQNTTGVDPSAIVQQLLLKSEPKAKLSVVNKDTGKLDGRAMSRSDIPKVNGQYVNHSTGGYALWQKSGNSGVSGTVATATYTNLSNSTYNGKKISKIIYTFSDLGKTNYTANGDTPELDILQDPTEFIWYLNSEGVTFKANYYDSNNKLIPFSGTDSYVTAGSLNAWYTNSNHEPASSGTKGVVESVQAVSGATAKSLKGSSVTLHGGNDLFADKANSVAPGIGGFVPKGYEDWDTPNDRHSIFGAGLISFKGSNPTLRFHAQRDDQTYAAKSGTAIWATFSTTIPSAVIPAAPKKPTAPKEPTKPTEPKAPVQKTESVNYHLIDLNVDTVKSFQAKFIEQTK